MFIAVTKVKAPKEAIDRMMMGFKHAAPAMQQFSGFLGLELWRGEESLHAVSRWESREAMEVYSNSDLFRAHHGGGSGAQGPGGQVEYFDAEVVI